MTKLSYQLIDKKTKEVKLETTSWDDAKTYQTQNGGPGRIELVKILTPINNPKLF